MKIYFDIPEIKTKSTVAIGTFDGVHLGHQEVLKYARNLSKKSHNSSIVFTFNDHPATSLKNKRPPFLLTTVTEKISLLEKQSLDICIIIPFTEGIAQLSPIEFIESILINRLNASDICVGYDFHFGKKAMGSGETLKEFENKYGYKTHIIEPVKYNNEIVSSSKIRNLLIDGKINLANTLLTRNYSLKGRVITGQGIAKKILGFPTANIQVDDRKLIPALGVYTCYVNISNKYYKGVVNIGNRPTFGHSELSIEVFILDFNKNIYDQVIEIELNSFLRPEKKFSDITELKSQINKDIKKTQQILATKV